MEEENQTEDKSSDQTEPVKELLITEPEETIINTKIPERKSKGNYCFPNIMAKAMRNVSQKIQYESSIMSMVVILLGIMALGSYSVFFTEFSFFVKMMTVLNMGAAFIFLSSTLVTTYQQYFHFLEVMDLIEDYNKDG